MATLNFRGPFHWNHLANLDLKEKSGIYIWGFVLDTNVNGELNLPFDYSINNIPNCEANGCNLRIDVKFVPYYVGRSNNIESRLNEHKKITVGDALKYTRLNFNYYKSFFSDNDLPINVGQNKWIISSPNYKNSLIGKIEYFNDSDILKLIYSNNISPIGKTGSYLITDQSYILRDTLKEIVEFRNNFWFCFAELSNPTDIDEAQVFYSLKGKTTSKTLDYYAKCNDFYNQIIPSSSVQCIFKNTHSPLFTGY